MQTNNLFLALIGCSIWLTSCSLCSNTAQNGVTSPDGEVVATVYERDCGATTDFSSMVNVQSTTEKFRADDGIVFVAKGRHQISVVWTGPSGLLITCETCAPETVFRQVVKFGDIDVKYSFPRVPIESLDPSRDVDTNR